MVIQEIKKYAKLILNEKKIISAKRGDSGRKNYIASELLRNTHSIEKGLSLEEPRYGFGHQKQKEMMEQIDFLYQERFPYYKEICKMAIGALYDYVDFHDAVQYNDEFITEIKKFLAKYPAAKDKIGGAIQIDKKDLKFNIEAVEYFFKTRHSVRDFDSAPVPDSILMKALSLAQTAPSACNRQAVRAYVLSLEKSKELSKQLTGVGGFAEKANRFIIITGKTSQYRNDEVDQYIVSASFFAAYASLTLHLYGLGACIVQQPVTWSHNEDETRNNLQIPEDEQIVCLVAIGNLKSQFPVPMSHRISSNEIVRFID